MIAQSIANIICATAMISVFIGIFFFTYASKIEQNIVVKRSTEIVNDITDNMKVVIPNSQKEILKNQIVPYLTIPDSLNEADKDVENANAALRSTALKYIVVFAIVCLGIVGIIAFVNKFSFLEIIEENIIILVFVALTEFLFLTFFAQNYITIDANFVKEKLIDSILKVGSS